MGAWGPHRFDNDVAADWRDQNGADLSAAALALDSVLDKRDDTLKADTASIAIAVPAAQMLEAIKTRLQGIEADLAMLRAELADGFRGLRIAQEETQA